jgi:hypothetical protein
VLIIGLTGRTAEGLLQELAACPKLQELMLRPTTQVISRLVPSEAAGLTGAGLEALMQGACARSLRRLVRGRDEGHPAGGKDTEWLRAELPGLVALEVLCLKLDDWGQGAAAQQAEGPVGRQRAGLEAMLRRMRAGGLAS